ncbi:hypothetical protein GGS26DRAFT_387873 [Hypomontagnella submonticulosa]|nr:hypothetical protein GGS26DRAFT_387873 [Hypomontagnella submonticulosa]
MFPIDRSLLPSLATRRALIVVDPQNDFLSEDGALPIRMPMDLPERIADLATRFRQGGGDVIWVCSRYEKSRSVLDEQVLLSEWAYQPRSPDLSRGRRRQTPPQPIQPTECPEAFLTQEAPNLPKCVRSGTFGAEVHPTVKEAVGPRDYSVVKSYYSAFRSEQLLRLLRMRLVTELFICGSITNISVMATAVDAASHGYTITIVDDCCGFNSITRQRAAIKQISSTTGCDILSAGDVMATFKPKTKLSRRSGDRPATSPVGGYSSVRRVKEEDDSALSSTSEILSSFENLSLSAQRTADVPDNEPPTQDSTLPIQSLVKSTTETESKQQSIGDSPTPTTNSKSDIVDTALRQEKPDESQNSGTNDNKAQGGVTPPPTARSNSNVSQEASEIPQSNKEQEPIVSYLCPLKGEKSPASTEANDPCASSGKTAESIGNMSETSKEKQPERIEAPSDESNAEVNNNSTIASEEVTWPKESEPLCEGDTKVIYDVLPTPLSEDIFEKIRDEVRWQRMSHQGGDVPRLVAVQGQVDQEGNVPVYRHPADESPALLPFSPTVLEVKKVVEEHLGHTLNHALIQFYRDGNDYISEHSDKTLDIVKGSFIANVSLGAERTMMFRTKRSLKNNKASADAEVFSVGPRRQIQRARLPHNSLCKMGLTSNMKWLHGIRQDKRPDREKSDEELAYDGGRISLTFRQIGTFLDRDSRLIWGQGATSKTKETANQVVNGQTSQAVKMLQGFGRENQSTDFDWNEYYGAGFDVLHISTAPRLFLSPDPVVNMRIQLMLAEYEISYARGSMSPLFNWKDGKPTKDPSAIPDDLPIKFVDNDFAKTVVQGEAAIMLYLERVYGQQGEDGDLPRRDLAKAFTRFQQGINLLEKFRSSTDIKAFKAELNIWEGYARDEGPDAFIAGPAMTLADYAFWPVLNDIIRVPGQCEFGGGGFPNLRMYHERIRTRDCGRKVLVACATCIRKKPDGTTDADTIASASAPTPGYNSLANAGRSSE